jgi:2-C-methyl-D-erythritol 4-phosphate cytidylyltransferase
VIRSPQKFIALVPAAGSGSRMGLALPKQYLPLAGRPMLHHTLAALLAHPRIDAVVLALAPDDRYWQDDLRDARLQVLRCGGATRAATVGQALAALAAYCADDDWLLVHDAARPCLSQAELSGLLDSLQDDPVGGLLAVPVADTLKRADAAGRVAQTPDRRDLWQAQTPQMFRYGLLCRALRAAGDAVTDEASAIEHLGLAPRLVAGRRSNLKLTYAGDRELVEWILENQHD